MKNLSNRWRRGGAAVWIIALLALLAWAIWGYGDQIGLVEKHRKVLAFLLIVAIAMVGHLNPRLLMYLKRQSHREQGAANNVYPRADANPVLPKKPAFSLSELQDYLRENHGLFWRFKVRLLLVVGEEPQIDAIAPSLKDKYWLAGHDTILLWGGSTQSKFHEGRVAPWQGLSRWRALDGVVWALTSEQSAETRAMDEGVRHLKDLARQLHWQLPLHLWQVCDSPWEQDKRPTQPVGCLLPSPVTPLEVESALESLVQPLRSGGWAQIGKVKGHDFLLRLSRDLQSEGIARWRQALAPLFRVFARGVPLRGLWFSLPLQAAPDNKFNLWHATPPWEGVLGDKKIRHRRLGWGVPSIVYAFSLGLMLLWGAGMLLSFATNRTHIAEAQSALLALGQAQSPDEQFLALNELTRELGRLDYRAKHGTPWYQRFGLNRNEQLLATLWPRYVEANTRLMRDPAVANLERQFTALINLPPASPLRAERAPAAHAQLKAYLMLARPEKADPVFLGKALTDAEPLRDGISPGLWQTLSPSLWQFYAEQLVEHPEWWIQSDPRLITQTRQVLLGQLGQRNAETSLYQKVLDDTAKHYPALGLQQLVGDTDARALFSTDASIPGVFTRQAWEGQVRQAIDAIAEARREEIDWVLSDQQHEIAAELTPDELKAHLTERYFQDYANAWLGFLNGLRWQPVSSLGEVIDQLTLMSDVRQSPLIALMNTLSYQGQAGTRGQGLTDSLVKSAQKLIAQDQVKLIEQMTTSSSPLDATFGPLLSLLGKDPKARTTPTA